MELKRNTIQIAELGIAVIAITALILAGCGGGSSSGSSTSTNVATPAGAAITSTSITPYKGMFLSGSVSLKDASGVPVTLYNNTGVITASGVAPVTFLSDVNYPLTISVTGTYLNEAASGVGAASGIATTVPLRGFIPDATIGASGVPVTLITDIAVSYFNGVNGTVGIGSASAVAAIAGAASSVLGFSYKEAMTPPVFNSNGKTDDVKTLQLSALSLMASAAGNGNGPMAGLRAMEVNLAAGSAVSAVFKPSDYSSAVGFVNTTAAPYGMLPTGTLNSTQMPIFTVSPDPIASAVAGTTTLANAVVAVNSYIGTATTTGIASWTPAVPATTAASAIPDTAVLWTATDNKDGSYTRTATSECKQLNGSTWGPAAPRDYVLSAQTTGWTDKCTLGGSGINNGDGSITVTDPAYGTYTTTLSQTVGTAIGASAVYPAGSIAYTTPDITTANDSYVIHSGYAVIEASITVSGKSASVTSIKAMTQAITSSSYFCVSTASGSFLFWPGLNGTHNIFLPTACDVSSMNNASIIVNNVTLKAVVVPNSNSTQVTQVTGSNTQYQKMNNMVFGQAQAGGTVLAGEFIPAATAIPSPLNGKNKTAINAELAANSKPALP